MDILQFAYGALRHLELINVLPVHKSMPDCTFQFAPLHGDCILRFKQAGHIESYFHFMALISKDKVTI